MKIILISLFLSFQMFPQMGKPKNRLLPKSVITQTDLAKNYIPKYLAKIGKTMKSCAGHYLKGSNFHWLRKVAGDDIFNKVFKYNEHKKAPATDNQFSFGYGEIAEVCQHEYGYCFGHTASLLLWNRMAYFDKLNVFGHKVPTEKFSEKWHQFYFELIDKIMHKREVVVIPGYENLYEFSKASPHITRYLKEHIALMWARMNINASGFFKIFRSIYNKFDAKEALHLHSTLKHKIEVLGFNPVVFVTSDNAIKEGLSMPSNASIHVMQAYKVSEIDADGVYEIHFWDLSTPHDARDSSSIYRVGTKPIKDNEKIQILKVGGAEGSHYDKRKTQEFDATYFFSDIEQVPYDDLALGDDAAQMLKFFAKYPDYVSQYLEPKYQESLITKKRAYFPKYEGSLDSIKPLILKNGKDWKWNRDQLDLNGQIYIDDYFIENTPDDVKEVLSLFDKDWKNSKTLSPELQYPKPFFYSTVDDTFQSEFSWPRTWVQYDGSVKIPEDYEHHLDAKFLDFLDESFIKFDSKLLTDPTYLAPQQRVVKVSEDENYILKMDFIDKDGYLVIPEKLISQLNPKILQFFKKSGVWPLTTKIKVDQLNEGLELRSGSERWQIPLSYLATPGKIKIPTDAVETLPKWVREAFCGYGPNAKCLGEYYIRDFEQHIVKIPTGNNQDVEEFIIPHAWNPIHGEEQLEENTFIVSLRIPEDQLEYLPQTFRNILVGVGGVYPPESSAFAMSPLTVYQKDGTPYTFPLSWLSFSVEGGMPGYSLRVPAQDASLVPQAIKDEVFGSGPVKFAVDKTLNLAKIQPEVIWHQVQDTEIYKPLIYPQEWTNKKGDIQVPELQSEIDKYFSAQEQESILWVDPFFEPGAIIEVHRGPFSIDL